MKNIMLLIRRKNWRTRLLFLASIGVVGSSLNSAESHDAEVVKQRLCNLGHYGLIKETPLTVHPSYFFKPAPDGREVFYIKNGNHRLNLETGEAVHVPGPYDAVPTPDGKYVTTPAKFNIYRYSKNEKTYQSILFDPDMPGAYQSVGMISSSEEKSSYRVIIASGKSLSMREYEVTHSTPSSNATSRALGPVKKICQDQNLSLPMLSKDGTMLSGVDNDKSPLVTRIYRVNPADGSCKEVSNLGIATGKLEFSYDNDWVAFHVFSNEYYANQFETPNESFVGNIYVYQMSTGQMVRITNNTDRNSVYPGWRRDGSLVYLNHYRSGSSKPASFSEVQPFTGPKTKLSDFSYTSEDSSDKLSHWQKKEALGVLWGKLCYSKENVLTPAHAALHVASMGKQECNELVEEFWEKKKSEVISRIDEETRSHNKPSHEFLSHLSKSDLVAECPNSELPKDHPVSALQPANVEAKPAQPKSHAVPDSCRDCHSGSIPFDDINALRSMRAGNGKPMVDDILDRVKSTEKTSVMPKPGYPHLTEEKIAELERYLKGTTAQTTERRAPPTLTKETHRRP